MQVNIQEILIKAIEQFQLFSDSIEKREDAYIKFFYQFLTKYFQDKGYSNLLVLAESAIQIGERNIRPDLIISERNSGKMLAVIELVSNISIHYNIIVERFVFNNETPVYFISFIENPKTTWQQYLEVFSKNNILVQDISEKEKKGIKIAISSTISNQKMYHIGVWVENRFQKQKSQNKMESIRLYNFKLFENLEISLSPSINIFLGKNGFGKTSILQAIAMANLPENSIELKYKKYLKQGQEAAEIYLQREHEREMRITLDTEKKIHETAFVQEPLFLAYGPNIFSKDTLISILS